MKLDPADVEREVRRLSPWYYRFDLGGVSTDITPPCDDHGHREVRLPDVAELLLRGKTVLDVACNEGGYSFAALDRGAGHVTGFDVRPINVEKARFVARVRGIERARFHESSCDAWLREPREPVDYVFLCGLLYHLVEPWRTIREYCALAREGLFVTCVLNGGEDGYTPFPEQENVAASEDPSELSQMPNTTRTLLRAFAEHGFFPALIGESRGTRFWGGCSILFRRAEMRTLEAGAGEPVELSLAPASDPARPEALDITLYNWTEEPLEVDGTLTWTAPGGSPRVLGPQRVTLPGRVRTPEDEASRSVTVPVALPLASTGGEVELRAEAPESGETLARRRVWIEPAGG